MEPPPPEPIVIEALVDAAKQQRPERAALVKRVEAAAERSRAAAAGLKPTIAVGGGVEYARPNPRIFPREARWRTSWDASVNANWPLFDGGRARADAAEAGALARAVQERLADLDAALAVEVRQRFRAGVATSTDVLDAQVAILQAELDRTQAIANARVARARLDRALGR